MLSMSDDRIPKASLFSSFYLEAEEGNIEKYNWVSLIQKKFFTPINEISFFKNLESFEQLAQINVRENLFKKFELALRGID